MNYVILMSGEGDFVATSPTYSYMVLSCSRHIRIDSAVELLLPTNDVCMAV